MLLSALKIRLKETRLYEPWLDFRQRQEMRRWKRVGGPRIPHARKQEIVREYGRRYGVDTLVETGTYLGLMVRAMRREFETVYSIELDEALFRRAQARFGRYSNVHLMQGDSSKLLPELLNRITNPALFWLDAHWSGDITARGETDTPIREELAAVLTHPVAAQHVVLIDDAGDFDGGDYPTITAVRSLVNQLHPTLRVEVGENIIRISPPSSETDTVQSHR